jgi:hypothetical protein
MREINEMIGIVENWFHKDTDENKKMFLETPKEKLISYHTTLGRSIRNEFKLWDREWKPDVRNGVDYSPDHPDQISMRVIHGVWERLRNS